MTKFILIVLAIFSFSVPLKSFGQDAARSTGEAVIAAPADVATSTGIAPRNNPATPAPTPPKVIESAVPVLPTATTGEGEPANTDPQEKNNILFYIILGLAASAVLAYAASRFIRKTKNETDNEKDNQKCDSIKKMLEQKIKELEEETKKWPEEKIKQILKEAAMNKFLSEQEKELLKKAEAAKEKYEKLKETAEILRGKYDLCKLELKNGGAKTLKFRNFKTEMILRGEKTASLRLFDDKNLTVGDELELINWDTRKSFAKAKITGIVEKKLGEIIDSDLAGHEPFPKGIINDLKKYYGDKINQKTLSKIVRFKLIRKIK